MCIAMKELYGHQEPSESWLLIHFPVLLVAEESSFGDPGFQKRACASHFCSSSFLSSFVALYNFEPLVSSPVKKLSVLARCTGLRVSTLS